jgi:pantoate--beta-alanine ligase
MQNYNFLRKLYLKYYVCILFKLKYMHIFNNQDDLSQHLKSFSYDNSTIGFVPTMGALHQGHLTLLAEAFFNNDITVCSIFVNPTQFNNPEDLENYPRTLEADVEKIKIVSDKIIVYAPTVNDIYVNDVISVHFDYGGIENQMEGKFRPGHFDGVGTIVKRLFEIIKPTNAYFGEKDFQQLQIVKKLVEIENISVNIIGCEIYREPNGLAMSSRNERLTSSQRDKAGIIFETLNQAKEMFKIETAEEVTDWVFGKFRLQSQFKLEYFEIADEKNLLPCTTKEQNVNYRAFIAVFADKVRLIDTISF